MQIRILGPLEVETDSGVVALGGLKQRTVLAVLALHHGEVVSPDILIEAAWGDQLPENPSNTLQYQIAQLRKILEDAPSAPTRVLTRSEGYMLDSETTNLDANEFASLVLKARAAYERGDLSQAAEAIAASLDLWSGPALGDFRYNEFAHADATRLDGERLAAEEFSIDIAMAEGRHGEIVPSLSQLTIDNPAREGLWARWMTALYRDGNQTDALRVYQQAYDALAEFGIEPSAELRDLEQRILDQDPALGPQATHEVRGTTLGNLPTPSNRLIGRTRELQDVSARLTSHRLVTLIGAGGAGKTRLALEVARATKHLYPDGVWLVRLDQLDNADLLTSQVGQTIGLREDPERDIMDSLVNQLSEREILIVLDNCEHLVDAVATFTFEFLERCAQARILATSQITLNVQGEYVIDVHPLTLPGHSDSIYDRLEDVAAVALFLERARPSDVASGEWSDAELVAVSNIVTALDGVPLAVELAAARTRSMSLDEIAQGLSEPGTVLIKGSRTAPTRQQSLQGVVEWSLNLLGPSQRSSLLKLSVFVGGFDAESAAFVIEASTSAARQLLGELVDRSLLARADDLEGKARYRMLETVRQYCMGLLNDAELAAAKAAHLARFDQFVEQAAAGIVGHDQMTWLARTNAEYENIRSGLAWTVEGGPIEVGLRIGANLGRWWDWRGLLKEASEWLGRLGNAATVALPGLATVLAWQAFLYWEFGDVTQASEMIMRAQAAADETGDPAERAALLLVEALIARSTGDLENARRDCERIIEMEGAYTDEWTVAWAYSALATIDLEDGDLDGSASHAAIATDMFLERGDLRGSGWGLVSAAHAAFGRGNLDSAEQLARDALDASTRTVDHRNVSWVLELLAEIATERDDNEHAALLWGAAHPFLRQRGLTSSASKRDELKAVEATLRDRLGSSFQESFATGSVDPDSVISQELGHTRANSQP